MLIVLHWFLSNISKKDLWPSPPINYALRSCQEIPLRSEASRVILNSTKVCNNSTRNCTKVLSRKNDGVSYMLVVAGQVDSSSNQSWSKWSLWWRRQKWNCYPSEQTKSRGMQREKNQLKQVHHSNNRNKVSRLILRISCFQGWNLPSARASSYNILMLIFPIRIVSMNKNQRNVCSKLRLVGTTSAKNQRIHCPSFKKTVYLIIGN